MIEVNGVRSSCDTSAMKSSFTCMARSSWASFSSSRFIWVSHIAAEAAIPAEARDASATTCDRVGPSADWNAREGQTDADEQDSAEACGEQDPAAPEHDAEPHCGYGDEGVHRLRAGAQVEHQRQA